jgi:hypothetical protein
MTAEIKCKMNFFFPILVWFSGVLVLAGLPQHEIRLAARLFFFCFVIGVVRDLCYYFNENDIPGAYKQASHEFALAPPGAKIVFPEAPPGWHMDLIKHKP